VVHVSGARQAGKNNLIRPLSEETGRQYITLDEEILWGKVTSGSQCLINPREDDNISIDEVPYISCLVLAIKQVLDRLSVKQKV
jgi:hypothetical protein